MSTNDDGTFSLGFVPGSYPLDPQPRLYEEVAPERLWLVGRDGFIPARWNTSALDHGDEYLTYVRGDAYDHLLAVLETINRITSPGNRTLDEMTRDMDYACDTARAAITESTRSKP